MKPGPEQSSHLELFARPKIAGNSLSSCQSSVLTFSFQTTILAVPSSNCFSSLVRSRPALPFNKCFYNPHFACRCFSQRLQDWQGLLLTFKNSLQLLRFFFMLAMRLFGWIATHVNAASLRYCFPFP